MTKETKEKEFAVNPSSIAGVTQGAEKNTPQNQPMSKGEKIFHWVVYSGINYWLNLGLSVVIADYFRNLSGKKYLDKVIDGFSKLLSSVKIPADKAKSFSKSSLGALALMVGGWLLLVPMKYMEDRKRPIVHWLNKKLGVRQIAPDGQALSHDEIYIEKEQPEQTWGNVIKRRIYATIAVTAIAGPLIEHTVGEKKATDFIARQANKGLQSGFVPGGKWLVENPRSQRYIKLAALDTFYTLITALVMRVTNGAKKAKPHQKVAGELATLNGNRIVSSAAERADAQTPHEKFSDKRKTIIAGGQKDFRTRAKIKTTEPSLATP